MLASGTRPARRARRPACLAVDAERVGGVAHVVRVTLLAAEDVVGGDVHQVGAGPGAGVGDVLRSGRVDGVGPVGIGFGAVDVGGGRAVHHQVVLGNEPLGGPGVGDVPFPMCQRAHLIAPAGRLTCEKPPDLAPGTRDHDSFHHDFESGTPVSATGYAPFSPVAWADAC